MCVCTQTACVGRGSCWVTRHKKGQEISVLILWWRRTLNTWKRDARSSGRALRCESTLLLFFFTMTTAVQLKQTTARRAFLLWLRVGLWYSYLHDYRRHRVPTIRAETVFLGFMAFTQWVNCLLSSPQNELSWNVRCWNAKRRAQLTSEQLSKWVISTECKFCIDLVHK